LVLSGALSFIVGKKEEPILNNRTAHRRAERVANDLSGNIWKTRIQFGLLVEPVVRRRDGGSVILINGAVETICAALGDQCNLSARRAPFIGVGAKRRDPEFLY